MPSKRRRVKLDEFHYHEALHTASVLMDAFAHRCRTARGRCIAGGRVQVSKCPMCGAPAKFEVHLPDGTKLAADNLTQANALLRTHQRAWPNEDLVITVAAPDTPSNVLQPEKKA
jgi:hypothetical protein